MQAAYIVFPPRLPAMTTQFADSAGETPYRSQNAAVSASAGSISATSTSSAPGHSRNAAATGAASNSGRDSADWNDSTSLMPPIQPDWPLSLVRRRARPAPGRMQGGKLLCRGGQSDLFFPPVWSRDP